MFNFFHSIIAKIVVGISSVALFFSGAATTPTIAPLDATSSAQVEIVATSTTTAAPTTKTEPGAKQDAPKGNKDSVIDSLKKQVADLTQKVSQPKVETPKTSVITLPNGAVVEMDANGNIIRTITAPPQQTYTTPTPTVQSQTSATVQISSVNITPAITSAKIEWQTDKPTESKIFLSGGGLSSKLYKSESGLSTRHSVSISGLVGDTNYTYEMEAIAGETFAKKNGGFRTEVPLPVPKFVGLPAITVIEKGILAEKLYTFGVRIETDIPTNVIFSATNAGYQSTSPATVHTFQVSVPVNYHDFSVTATSEGGTVKYSGKFYDFY